MVSQGIIRLIKHSVQRQVLCRMAENDQKNKDAFSSYYNDFHVELEKVNGLPYVEIEVTTDNLPADQVSKNLQDFVVSLGLDPSKRDSRSWMEIILDGKEK